MAIYWVLVERTSRDYSDFLSGVYSEMPNNLVDTVVAPSPRKAKQLFAVRHGITDERIKIVEVYRHG